MADKLPQHISPKGVFMYPKLTTPDTKYKAEGEFSVKLSVPASEAEELMKMADEGAAASLSEAKENAGSPVKAKKWETKYLPYELEEDEDGNETGNVIFKFSSKASGVTKAGKAWRKKSVSLVDAAGKPMRAVDVWGGTIGYIAFKIIPYSPTPQVGASVKFQLDAAQIIKLVQGGERDGAAFGFAAEEGFSVDDLPDDVEEDEDDLEDDDDEEDEKDF